MITRDKPRTPAPYVEPEPTHKASDLKTFRFRDGVDMLTAADINWILDKLADLDRRADN